MTTEKTPPMMPADLIAVLEKATPEQVREMRDLLFPILVPDAPIFDPLISPSGFPWTSSDPRVLADLPNPFAEAEPFARIVGNQP